MKVYKYYRHHSYTNENGKEVSLSTQQYEIGTYCILNNDPALQFSSNPPRLARLEKKLLKLEAESKIKDLHLAGEMTITLENGFWKIL